MGNRTSLGRTRATRVQAPTAGKLLSTRRASNARRTPEIIEQRQTKQSTAEGLRYRSGPTCTLSQTGYGTDAQVSNHVVLFVIFDA